MVTNQLNSPAFRTLSSSDKSRSCSLQPLSVGFGTGSLRLASHSVRNFVSTERLPLIPPACLRVEEFGLEGTNFQRPHWLRRPGYNSIAVGLAPAEHILRGHRAHEALELLLAVGQSPCHGDLSGKTMSSPRMARAASSFLKMVSIIVCDFRIAHPSLFELSNFVRCL